MVMKASGLSSSSKEEEPKKVKVEKKIEEPKKVPPYRYKDADGNWAWKLD